MQKNLPSLNDVMIAIIRSDDDDRLCPRFVGSINVEGLHTDEVACRYVSRCILPCGDEGHLTRIFVNIGGDVTQHWVH